LVYLDQEKSGNPGSGVQAGWPDGANFRHSGPLFYFGQFCENYKCMKGSLA
jgi:hypothetical protein